MRGGNAKENNDKEEETEDRTMRMQRKRHDWGLQRGMWVRFRQAGGERGRQAGVRAAEETDNQLRGGGWRVGRQG